MDKPDRVNILGINYTIQYFTNPSEVDPSGRESLWGSIDYWDRIIRVYDNNRNIEDIWQIIFHEILHGIANALKLSLDNKDKHDELDILALALTDILFRNEWIKND